MVLAAHFTYQWIDSLIKRQGDYLLGSLNGASYRARVVIPGYREKIAAYYSPELTMPVDAVCVNAQVPIPYDHYGVEIYFDQHTQLDIQQASEVLDDGLKTLMQRFGPVILKNVFLPPAYRQVQQRNIFPHLNFHVDRSIGMPTRFSVYTRDPFDVEQKLPRKSSTLFCSIAVGYLQAIREGIVQPGEERGIGQSYEIFKQMDLKPLINQLLIEHRWDEPEGVGEMSMLDNATELHSSYERDFCVRGYKIGVRYMA